MLWTTMEKPECVPLQDWTKCLWLSPDLGHVHYRDCSARAYKHGPMGQLSLAMHIPTSTQFICRWASKYLVAIQCESWCTAFHDWFWWITFPHSCYCADHSQLSQGPILHYVRSTAFIIHGTRLSFNHFMLPESLCTLLEINFHPFYAFWDYFVFHYFYFRSSWNQIGILYWKWILTFVKVLLVPITDKHRDAIVYIYSRKCRVMLHIRTMWAAVHH
jgi:hypothetical protein